MTTKIIFYYELVFDYWLFMGCVIFAFVMFYIASKLEDPSRKRVKNIENMLTKHVEDGKFTIETMQNIGKSNQEIITLLKSKL
jgi:hypothetical protein